DGVAVRSRADGPANRDASVRPSHVFDDDGLPQRHAHSFGYDARNSVSWSTCSERNNQGDGTCRIGLGCGNAVCVESGGNYRKCKNENAITVHGRLLCWKLSATPFNAKSGQIMLAAQVIRP